MDDASLTRAIELLQELGLKQYEARCFVALTRMEDATAREISDVSAVPRTRVYEATDSLETRGLIAVQHAQPQRFRAIPISEALTVLRRQYEDRVESLQAALERAEPVEDVATGADEEVWHISGRDAVEARSRELVTSADSEVVFIVDDDRYESAPLTELESASERGVSVVVGALKAGEPEWVSSVRPAVQVLDEDLSWLRTDANASSDVGRIVVADREAFLVSSASRHTHSEESAIFSRGSTNGLMLVVQRALATALG